LPPSALALLSRLVLLQAFEAAALQKTPELVIVE
jgi:hypothetical protein